jgi:hypothetical protein
MFTETSCIGMLAASRKAAQLAIHTCDAGRQSMPELSAALRGVDLFTIDRPLRDAVATYAAVAALAAAPALATARAGNPALWVSGWQFWLRQRLCANARRQ